MNVIDIGDVEVVFDEESVQWQGPLAVDADGAARAYAPPGSGLVGTDNIANAGREGNYFGVETDTGDRTGKPLVQPAFYPNVDGTPSSEPNPTAGFWLSATALKDKTRARSDPRRYVDAAVVPYISIPRDLFHRPIELGDVCAVSWRQCDPIAAIVADVGPHGRIGEGSICLAQMLGYDPIVKPGHLSGIDAGVSVKVFRGSSRGWPRSLDDIRAQLAELLVPVTVPAPQLTGGSGA